MGSVLITVQGGLAEIAERPKGVEVEVIDLDVLREGADDDVTTYWRSRLSSKGRRYVKRKFPQLVPSRT